MSNTQVNLIVKEKGICIYRVHSKPDFEALKNDKIYQDYKFFSGYKDTDIEKQYEDEVKQAQSSAILVEDQVEALSLIQKFYYIDHVKIGSIYPVPGIEFEEIQYCRLVASHYTSEWLSPEEKNKFLKYNDFKTVARLIEHTAEKESPEIDKEEEQAWRIFKDDLWNGVQRILRDKGCASKEVFDAINYTSDELRKQWTVSRNVNE